MTATAMMLLPAACAFAQRVEVSVTGGWTLSDGVSGAPILAGDGNLYDRVDSKDSGSWGFGVGVNASDNAEVGFLFGQQLSTLEISGTTTVVGVLVERGASSGALAPIFAQLPNDIGVNHPLPAPFNPSNFLPADRAYYRYEGSLTTPPCTEGVHWIVLKDPITVSSEDLAQYHERIHFNARPVQRFAR